MIRRIFVATALAAATLAAPAAFAGNNVGWSVSLGAPGVGVTVGQPAYGYGGTAVGVAVGAPLYGWNSYWGPPAVAYPAYPAYPAYRAVYAPHPHHYRPYYAPVTYRAPVVVAPAYVPAPRPGPYRPYY